MDLPLRFTAIYECADCGEQIVMENFYAPRIFIPCQDCGVKSYFYAEEIIHKSWEWDTIELFELPGEEDE